MWDKFRHSRLFVGLVIVAVLLAWGIVGEMDYQWQQDLELIHQQNMQELQISTTEIAEKQ